MTISNYVKGILSATAASLLAAVVTVGVAKYSEVEANTLHRQQSELLLKSINDTVIRVEENQKFLRINQDNLNSDQKYLLERIDGLYSKKDK